MVPRSCRLVCISILVAWGSMVPVTSGAGEATLAEAGDLPGRIHLAEYRASVFAHRESGSFLWLAGPSGLLRLEIRRGDGQGVLTALLGQEGQGWTAILDGAENGTINAWGESWHQAPAGLGQVVRIVSEVLQSGVPSSDVTVGPWRCRGADDRSMKYRIGALGGSVGSGSGKSDFRERLTRRGLGRGDRDELLELKWVVAAMDTTAWLMVRSTRRPGKLELAQQYSREVVYAMPETFVPLWPLARLVEIIKK